MSKVFSGSKGSLKLNGVKVAFVGSVSVEREDSLTEIDVLDQLEVAENAETGHKARASCNLFKVDENAAAKFGFDPDNIDDLLSQPELVLEVYNRISDKVEAVIEGVKRESGSGSMDARGVWQGSWSLRGRRARGF